MSRNVGLPDDKAGRRRSATFGRRRVTATPRLNSMPRHLIACLLASENYFAARGRDMVRRQHRGRTRAAPEGIWLALLAVAIQIFLPFLVAVEIKALSEPASAATTTICLSTDSIGASAHPGSQTTHHGLSDGCPICVALAVGQAFTSPSPVLAPIPQTAGASVVYEAPTASPPDYASAFYNPRAPPVLV